MTSTDDTSVTVLGLGAMGRVLAGALADGGHPTTVWNRSPGRAQAMSDRAGVTVAATAGEGVSASPLVVACLFDHASVHEVLDPVAGRLAGRALVNVTTTTPAEARELASWAAEHDIRYLDGGIMATPDMIGQPGSAILYSGDAALFDERRTMLDLWGESTYVGSDAGMASLWDLALLAGMYLMFAGFLHGAAMIGSEGVAARDLAARATPFLAAMTQAFAGIAELIDTADYAREGVQSLEFTDLSDLLQASRDQGVSTELVAPVQALIERQIAAGHGAEAFERIFEEIRSNKR